MLVDDVVSCCFVVIYHCHCHCTCCSSILCMVDYVLTTAVIISLFLTRTNLLVLLTAQSLPHTPQSPSRSFTSCNQPHSHLFHPLSLSPPRLHFDPPRCSSRSQWHTSTNPMQPPASFLLPASVPCITPHQPLLKARTQWRSSTLDLYPPTYYPSRSVTKRSIHLFRRPDMQTRSQGTTPPA